MVGYTKGVSCQKKMVDIYIWACGRTSEGNLLVAVLTTPPPPPPFNETLLF